MNRFDRTIGLKGPAKSLISAIFALICLAFLLSPAHANDNFPGTTITGNTGSLNASNATATGQAGEPLTYNGGSLNTMWYSWTAPSNGTLTLQTCGGTTNFDTTLQTFTGAAVNGLTQLVTNDDSCNTQSVNTVAVTAGTTYRVQVDGYGSATGNFTLSWAFVAATTSDLSLTKTVSNAAPSSGVTITYTLSVTNAAASGLPATGVTVTDNLPVGVTYLSATGSGVYDSATGIWNVGSLAIGETKQIVITATVTAAAGITVQNGAEVRTSSGTDPDSTPNNGSTTEDDDAFASFTVSSVRTAGTPPGIICPVGSNLFNWGSNTWTVGSLNNSYTLAGVGNFNIAMSSTTPYVAGSPAINGNLTGGVAGETSLYQNLNNNALSDTATTVITMPGGLPGIQFTLFDVDFGAASYSDKITVTGSYNGSPVIPVLTNGTANYVIGNTAIGDVSAGDTTAAGNVVVTFNNPVDTVTVVYGNHTTAPANPGNQWIGLGDLTFCNSYTTGGPTGNITLSKIDEVLSDGVSAANPKAIPGAVVRYCITFGNVGVLTVNSVSASDPLPADVTFVPGSIRSGTSCGTATTVEDDNNIGADETDPFGGFVSGSTVTGTAATIAAGGTYAMTFHVTVD
jgi:uncharacterized repeat protein (TIGR01451 family)